MKKSLTKLELQKLLSETSFHKEITASTGIPIWELENLISEYELQGYRDKIRYECLSDLFSLESPEFCYMLGLWVTDGYWNEGAVSISLSDRDVLERLGEHFKCKVYLSRREGMRPTYILSIPTRFCDYFTKLGYSIGVKTFDVHVPRVPDKNIKYLLRGMIDGDGTIRKGLRDYEVRFFTVSKLLFKQFEYYIKYLGYTYSTHDHKKYGETTISIRSLDFLVWLYSDRLDLCLDRKLKIVNDKVDDIVHAYSIVKSRRT